MFPSGMDFARESGGGVATGTVLIPTRFVWPYGGRTVYLSGSFTGWSEHFQMSPVEGCPTVFQTICSLPPGIHQYKFIVDGEWRHDERQPCVSSNFGTVNTVVLSRDSGYNSAILSPQIPSGSSMDVDNAVFQRLIRVSNDTSNDALPRISEAEIQVSRHRISSFLSTHTAYELLPESGKVIALDVDLPVKQAFHILHEQGITIAPLWDFGKGKFTGVLSALDFILIMRECPKQIANDGIFYGHYVGCFIEDVLRSGETNINVNFTRSNRHMCYARDKLDRFRDNWAGFLYNRFLKGKLLNM